MHHFYFPECDYKLASVEDSDNPARNFRQLPINKGLLPRYFENWLHTVTTDPVMPEPEVMHHQIESWTVALALFKNVRGAGIWEKRARRRAIAIPKQNTPFSLRLGS